jgi:LmbE family N-acetylglucosaminyl deacetylase
MKPLKILAFGAHPDDAELNVGGCAAMWAAQGHKVKFVSTTNGDVGHALKHGKELADIRKKEVEAAAKVLGIETAVMDVHDGELMPTLENRLIFLKYIREWEADIVIGHRPYDYHPDHRYTGILMQDAAFMVTVKYALPDVPCLAQNPVFLFSYDHFQTPIPFNPTIAVPVDSVMDKKLEALWCLESQIESYWYRENFVDVSPVPTDSEARAVRKQEFFDQCLWKPVWRRQADQYKVLIQHTYGAELANQCKYAESFEVCEYGRQPTPEELQDLFPDIAIQ